MSAQESAGNQEQPPSTNNAENTHPVFDNTQEDLTMETPDSPPDLYTHNQTSFDTPVTTPSKAAASLEKVNHGAPGSSWNTKKFREEYDRVFDGLIDKNWDGKTKYGDPLLQN